MSIHWYATDETEDLLGVKKGESVDLVPKASGGMTDRIQHHHVKKYALAAGCTSIIGMMDKPGLRIWGEKTVALEAYRIASAGKVEDEELFVKACLDGKNEIGTSAADKGSEIHDRIEKAIKAGELNSSPDPFVKVAAYELDKIIEGWATEGWYPVSIESEKSFVVNDEWLPCAFGGRTDVLIEFAKDWPTAETALFVADFKTRDFEVANVIKARKMLEDGCKTFDKLSPRDSEPLQIAANLAGHADQGIPKSRLFDTARSGVVLGGANIYISRLQSEAGFTYEWTPVQLERAWGAFTACLTLFNYTRNG